MEKFQNIIKNENTKIATVNIGVCSGKHEIPVDNFIFENNIDDSTDVVGLEKIAANWYIDTIMPLKHDGYDVDIHIYISRLTVATIAIVKVLFNYHRYCDYQYDEYYEVVPDGNVTLWHFDAINNNYYSQSIFKIDR